MGSEGWPSLSYFNSRPCERGDSCRAGNAVPNTCISIHAPARGATKKATAWSIWSMYFNSRPCERGDSEAYVQGFIYLISIHAPARGATGFLLPQDLKDIISIHAPARGATPR